VISDRIRTRYWRAIGSCLVAITYCVVSAGALSQSTASRSDMALAAMNDSATAAPVANDFGTASAVVKDLRLVDSPEFTGKESGLLSSISDLFSAMFPELPPSDAQPPGESGHPDRREGSGRSGVPVHQLALPVGDPLLERRVETRGRPRRALGLGASRRRSAPSLRLAALLVSGPWHAHAKHLGHGGAAQPDASADEARRPPDPAGRRRGLRNGQHEALLLHRHCVIFSSTARTIGEPFHGCFSEAIPDSRHLSDRQIQLLRDLVVSKAPGREKDDLRSAHVRRLRFGSKDEGLELCAFAVTQDQSSLL